MSPLKIKGKEFKSLLILGTGKYDDLDVMKRAFEVSGTEIVTVAVRRIDLDAVKEGKPSLLDYIDTDKITVLPNTAGCYNADEAVRTAQLGRAAGFSDMVKLEVIGDQKTLLPDTVELLRATEKLVKDGFTVLPYTTDDPIVAKKLEEAGAAAVMPLAAPIGSGIGIQTDLNIRFIMEEASVPVIVDAGVGTASDACRAMELGIDGILINTAVAQAKDPVKMAEAMRDAVIAGRLAFEAGRIPRKPYASASSPMEGVVR
jgi:thiazole synthase